MKHQSFLIQGSELGARLVPEKYKFRLLHLILVSLGLSIYSSEVIKDWFIKIDLFAPSAL